MQTKKKLTAEQCWSMASYLRTAADQFRAFAEQMRTAPTNIRLAQQFEKQRAEAMAMAILFENADSAHVAAQEDDPAPRNASREDQHARYIDCGPQAWDDRD